MNSEAIYPENALILAPLSGFTDLPYRRSARRHGGYFMFSEMVDAASLAHTPERGLALAARGEDEEFLGVQVVGADPEWLKRSKRRYFAAFVGGEADRVPVDPMMLSHSTVACGYTIRDFYEKPELAAVCLAHAQEMYDLLPVTKYYFAHPWLPELGVRLRFMDLTAPVPENTVVTDPEDVDRIHIPGLDEIMKGYSYNRLTRAMDYIKTNIPDMFISLAYCPEPVGSAAELCGIEQFLMWTQTEMDLCKRLCDIYVETASTGAEALAKRYGTALINTGAVLENSDTMSPETIKA